MWKYVLVSRIFIERATFFSYNTDIVARNHALAGGEHRSCPPAQGSTHYHRHQSQEHKRFILSLPWKYLVSRFSRSKPMVQEDDRKPLSVPLQWSSSKTTTDQKWDDWPKRAIGEPSLILPFPYGPGGTGIKAYSSRKQELENFRKEASTENKASNILGSTCPCGGHDQELRITKCWPQPTKEYRASLAPCIDHIIVCFPKDGTRYVDIGPKLDSYRLDHFGVNCHILGQRPEVVSPKGSNDTAIVDSRMDDKRWLKTRDLTQWFLPSGVNSEELNRSFPCDYVYMKAIRKSLQKDLSFWRLPF